MDHPPDVHLDDLQQQTTTFFSQQKKVKFGLLWILSCHFSRAPSPICFAWPKFLQLPLWCHVHVCKPTHWSLCDRQTYLIMFLCQPVLRTCRWSGREREPVRINHRFTNVSARSANTTPQCWNSLQQQISLPWWWNVHRHVLTWAFRQRYLLPRDYTTALLIRIIYTVLDGVIFPISWISTASIARVKAWKG